MMKNVKKFGWIIGVLGIVLSAVLFVGCNDTEKSGAAKGKKLSVVTTIYPEYAWVKEILGARVDSLDLVLLVKNGMDLHSFNPSAKDIATIANADVVVYVGGESDQWVAKALAATPKAGRVALNLMELPPLIWKRLEAMFIRLRWKSPALRV